MNTNIKTFFDLIQENKSETNTLLENSINQLEQAVLIIDNSGKIIYANHSTSLLTGYNSKYLINKDLSILKDNFTPLNNFNIFINFFNEKSTATYDTLVKSYYNVERKVRILFNPIKGSSKNIENHLIMISDLEKADQKLINRAENEAIIKTMTLVNDIVNNYLNHLQLFRIEFEDEYGIPKEKLEEFDAEFEKFNNKMHYLNQANSINKEIRNKQ